MGAAGTSGWRATRDRPSPPTRRMLPRSETAGIEIARGEGTIFATAARPTGRRPNPRARTLSVATRQPPHGRQTRSPKSPQPGTRVMNDSVDASMDSPGDPASRSTADGEDVLMVDLRPKRIAEFIEPFRVEPGRRVRLPKDFDPAGTASSPPTRRRRSSRQAIELLAEYQDAAGGPGHLRRGHGPPGDGRRRQGRHHPPRHERGQPPGRPGQQLQGPVVGGPRPRLPVALREEAAGARQHRHLQPLLLRGGPGRPGPPPDPGRPEDPAAGSRAATSGSGASARSTTGSTT